MLICTTKHDLQKTLVQFHQSGKTLGFVPTMGALHEGHLSLLKTCQENADICVSSIFVNPLQFGPNEDLDTYPRQLEHDQSILKTRGCDILFLPVKSELFSANFSTHVTVAEITENHCGRSRPAFFGGIATIVTKLLNIINPHIAVFGEKDFQQLTMIRRLVRDLDIPTKIIGGPTVREEDGLAMSSRNAYLSPEERQIAPTLFKLLSSLSKKLTTTDEDWSEMRAHCEKMLMQNGFAEIDYIDLVDSETLDIIDKPVNEARILAAARLGKTRLIDNVAVKKST